jgi:hypothetical protein
MRVSESWEMTAGHLIGGDAEAFVNHLAWNSAGEEAVIGAHRQADGGLYWTTMRVLPSGSRNQNIGGTGSPIRLTSVSTSTPASV